MLLREGALLTCEIPPKVLFSVMVVNCFRKQIGRKGGNPSLLQIP